MKILWFSNIDLCNTNPSASGTWIYSMYNALMKYTDIEVCANVTFTSNNIYYCKEDSQRRNYYIPYKYIKKDCRPDERALQSVGSIIEKEKPNLIHVWGTEKSWGLMLDDFVKQTIPCLVEIQGLSFFVAEERFYGGLGNHSIKKMKGPLEFIFPNLFIERIKKQFQRWGEIEKNMIQSFSFVNTQSEWVRQLIFWIAPKVMTFNTGIILRDSFLNSPLWSTQHTRGKDLILFTTSSPIPYKGLHTTLLAFSLILREVPTARLRIAGVSIHKSSWKDIGYVRFLRKMCVNLNIEQNVEFLGRLDEKGIISEMYNADLFVTSTYVESYCLALAEALCVGMPCVSAYTSAISELIDDGINGVLYPQGDYYVCAYKALELLNNECNSKRIGDRAALVQRKKSDPSNLALNQKKIYKDVYDAFMNISKV